MNLYLISTNLLMQKKYLKLNYAEKNLYSIDDYNKQIKGLLKIKNTR